MKYANEKCFSTCLNTLPSQDLDELEQFCNNFDLLLCNVVCFLNQPAYFLIGTVMQNVENGVLVIKIIQQELTQRYKSNSSPYNQETLFNQTRECAALITEGKERYISNMTTKLDNPENAPRTY